MKKIINWLIHKCGVTVTKNWQKYREFFCLSQETFFLFTEQWSMKHWKDFADFCCSCFNNSLKIWQHSGYAAAVGWHQMNNYYYQVVTLEWKKNNYTLLCGGHFTDEHSIETEFNKCVTERLIYENIYNRC